MERDFIEGINPNWTVQELHEKMEGWNELAPEGFKVAIDGDAQALYYQKVELTPEQENLVNQHREGK